ncbi:MAG: ATP-binding protein [Acidiferrobacteraceae bacterium]
MADTPALLIHGPRQCGKTTLARMLGKHYAYYSFDDRDLLAAAGRDPVGFVERLPARVILDEIQHVPELFAELKQAIDQQRQPGRFVLTGSANVLLLPRLSDSLAGRMEILPLYPLAQSELARKPPGFLDQVFSGKLAAYHTERLGKNLVTRIVAGGFPEPVQRTTAARRRAWYDSYIETLIQRDIRELSHIQHGDIIPKLLRLLANHTGQLLNVSEMAKAFQLSRHTIDGYVALLRQVFLVDFLSPWFSNRNKRLIRTPKIHLLDTGLACALMQLSQPQLEQQPTGFGQVLESFVYGELRKQASWRPESITFHYYRDKDQYEVDMVMEDSTGRFVGIEVKAAASIAESDFRGLRRFQRQIGKRFVAGVVLYDGRQVLSFGEDLFAAPLSVLWAT